MWGLATKQGLRQVNDLSAVDDAEVERFERGWAAEAFEDADDVNTETDEAESVYPRRGEEYLRCGKRVEAVRGRGADADVDADGKRGGALQPGNEEAWGDGRPEFAQAECR